MTGSLRIIGSTALFCAALGSSVSWAQANDGKVKAFARITTGSNGFVGPLLPGDQFGDSTTAIGDLDGNGSTDIAVGANAASGSTWSIRTCCRGC